MASSLSLETFTVRRHEVVLVTPSKPTPHELKPLSDIDDQQGLRFQVPFILFYGNNEASMEGRDDPGKVIRDAIAEALVFYYPFAGRLREGPDRKLMVDCTGEGVVFIEAEADVTLEQFGDALHPPFPCLEELLYDVPGTGEVLNCPLLLIQVTRLRCGGFIFALRLNHAMSDAYGIVQFMSTAGELARGAHAPSVPPVWDRHLLSARDPPRVTHAHREYEMPPHTNRTWMPIHQDRMAHRSFFFGKREIAALRSHVPPHLRACSTFQLLTAYLWRCRTIALGPESFHSEEHVRAICVVNPRGEYQPPLPAGYYGNVFALPVAISEAGKLRVEPLGYALDLVRRATREVTQEYIQSVADLVVSKGRPHFTVAGTFLVSDVTRVGFGAVDFGWGRPVYGAQAEGGVRAFPGMVSFCVRSRNARGEIGIAVPCCLPGPAMDRFVVEIESMIRGPKMVGPTNRNNSHHSKSVASKL